MKFGKKRLFDILGFGVVLAWLVMMGVLVKRSYFEAAPVTLSTYQEGSSLEENETWMAIYQHDNKIGFTRSRIIKQSDGYVVLESAVMNLRAIGDIHRISTEIIGHLNEDASLRSFVFQLVSGMVRFEARGRVEGKCLILNTGLCGERRKSEILLQEKPFLSIGLWPHLLKRGLIVGAHYRLSLFDPSVMAQRPVEVNVVGRETVVLDGRRWEAFKVKTIFAGLEIFTWIGPNGERLKEEGLMGLRLVKTTEDEARVGISSGPEIDIVEAASISSNKVLAEPSNLVYLKIRLDGIDPGGLDLNTGRQGLTGSVLEIALESNGRRYEDGTIAAEKPLPQKVELEPCLKADPLIQSDHPRIKILARKIVGEVKEDEARARRILNWVYESLDKRATVSVPNALDTLRARAGDCNEHAVLFAALLRAAGIPAKVCVGLVYTRGRFYYHAWNEIFVGEWKTADALMGQMPADVTHIKFVEGDLGRQVEMVRVIGRVKLTVLEAR
ncbi:MAG: transglutaminase domain-containing protein, partial [Deltaproteobacteria bacterium]|nr:transglutaminase domain-containing protein [Deltaproteobacteria bacterium]MBW1794164.1 transglutaminase domain-containing protein [Deltaproteobacteria bacterium]